MEIYTNLVWPDDPYRTGQQLYRRPAPRLAAFTVGRAVGGSRLPATSAAIVYLPLHRTKTLAVTQQTVVFGFHAARIASASEAPGLARAAGLVLLQARRNAAVLAGHAVHRALVIALVAARDLDRYTWEGTLHTDEIMAAGTWDCLPQLSAGHPAVMAEARATPARQPANAQRPEPE